MKIDVTQRAEDFVEHSENLKDRGKIRKATFDQRRYAMKELKEWFEKEDRVIDTKDYYESINNFKDFFDSVQIHPSKIGCIREMLLYIAEQLPEEHTEVVRDIHSRFKPSRFDEVATGYHPTNKQKRLKKKLLSDEQLAAVRAVADTEERLIIDCMLDMGTRPGELAALAPCDFNWDYDQGDIGATVYIEKTYVQGEGIQNEPKSQDGYRTVNLRKDTAERLREYIEEKGIKDDELIFQSYRHVYNKIKDVFTFAHIKIGDDGITEVGPHDLRHNTATRLIVEHEYPKEKVQRYMGHGTITVTETYEHFDGNQVVDIYG